LWSRWQTRFLNILHAGKNENQNNLGGVNLNMKHDEASSLKSPNGSSVGKKKFKENCFVCKKQRHICKDCCHCKGKKMHKATSLRMLMRKLLSLI